MFENSQNEHEIRDSVMGVVTCCSTKGLYLELESGRSAFTHFSKLPIGSTVYCTVLKKATERWLTLVAIDSVQELATDVIF